jgi:hypothetical protein
MEHEISLSCSQHSATFPIPSQMNTLHATPTRFFKIEFKLSSYFPSDVFPSGFHSLLFRMCYVPHPFHLFDLLTLIIFGKEQTTNRGAPHYAVFSPYSSHYLLTKPTCLPYHPILRLSEPVFPLMWGPNFTHISNSKQNYISVRFSALILR